MKRNISILIILVALLSLIACKDTINFEDSIDKGGLFQYELSEREKTLLHLLGIENKSQIIAFDAPHEAITLNIKIYTLDSANSWRVIGGSGISIGKERKPSEKLSGNFSILLKDNYAIDCYINSDGQVNIQTDEILLEKDILASGVLFFNEVIDIELEKEIPIALMIYSTENSLYTITLDDYFEPEKLADYELVQVVTMSFSENEF